MVGVFCLVALLASACQKDDIRAFPAPKEQSGAATMVQTPPEGGMETLGWTLPAGWTEVPGEGMRYATLLIETKQGGDPLEVRVTPLSLAAKDPLANVNRWREQIGLEHIGPEKLSDVAQSVELGGRQAHLVDLTGTAMDGKPPQRLLAAILPGDQRAWFFLIMDAAERVAPVASDFNAFMQSVTVRQEPAAGDLPPGHPPVGGSGASDMAGGTPGMEPPPMGAQDLPLRWTTPDGWSERSESNPSRLATLDVAKGESRAEVTITRFPGDVGGMLPNVNRWRGQLGLAPIQDLSSLEHPLEDVQVDGAPAQLLDLRGKAGDGQGMLVVLVPRGGFTYFVKMTGPGTLLADERETFVQFARGLRFETPHP